VKRSALALSLLYLALASAWILFSDRALQAVAPDLSSFAYIGTLKGLLFVFLTAVVLYGILQRHRASLEAEIVERRRSEEALHESRERLRQSQKLEALGQLAGGIAHDFNNLLMVIRGHAELLEGAAELTSRMRRSCEEIDRAVERASSLTQQLLMFSRRQALQLRDLDLNTVVEDTAKMLRRLVGEEVELEVRCTGEPLPVHADTGMLVQVLLNLSINARDAMPQGGRLLVETDRVERDGRRWACLSVTDAGTGIAPEILPRIFDPFFTTKDVGKGTGLGLATVFGVAEQHGGHVEVDSVVRRGSTFRVLLPLLTPGARPGAATPEPKPRGGGETILLVEDDGAVRDTVVDFLRRLGYRVLEAATGTEALSLEERFDLVITDVVLPGGISGFELGSRLAERHPDLKILYTSGYSPALAGKEVDLAKPFALNRLALTLGDSHL
jgi:two-component system cell cycle sensor histidine kinase/response regulator CckA